MSEKTKQEVAEMASDDMTAEDRAFLAGVATGLRAARSPDAEEVSSDD